MPKDCLLNILKVLKNSERSVLFKLVYKSKLDKVCFAQDAEYSDGKDLAKRTISDKSLKDRGYELAVNHKCDRYQRGLTRMVYKVLIKKQERGECKLRVNLIIKTS